MYYSLTQKNKKINTHGEEIIYEFFALYIEKKSNLWYNDLNCGGVRFSATPLLDKKQRNKMKNLYFLGTKLWVYLTEIPVVIILAVAIALNKYSEDIFKFYPLIIFLALAVGFIFVYFFRLISVSTEEIRFHGLFSSRDHAFITKGKTLYAILRRGRGMRLELYGDAGEVPAFDWMKATDVNHRDICFFRGNTSGGKKSLQRLAKFFFLPEDKLEDLLTDGFAFEDEKVKISTELKDENTILKINFKITII